MTERKLVREAWLRFSSVVLLVLLSGVGSAVGEEAVNGETGWWMGATLGVVDFVSPKRSASTISDATVGGVFSLYAIERPHPNLGIGCRGELSIVPSRERDARATLGGRGALMLRLVLPLKRVALHLTPEAGYAYLGRKVDFDNTSRVSFQGASVGIALGADVIVRGRFALGGIVRVTHILGGLTCTTERCHSPRKGRNPGPALLFGLSGAFRL